jgi:pimeloyl-ACP methyl ester carboxylesterase
MNEFSTSDGLRLRYVIDDYTDPWRQVSTVAMIHAAMASSRRFCAWVPHLTCDDRVVRLDVRGHGASAAPAPDQLSFERLVLDVKALIADCQFVVYEALPHNITDAVPGRCASDLHQFLKARA